MHHLRLGVALTVFLAGCGTQPSKNQSTADSRWTKYATTVSSFRTSSSTARGAVAACDIDGTLTAAGCPVPPKPRPDCLPPPPSEPEFQKVKSCLEKAEADPRECLPPPPALNASCFPQPQPIPAACWKVLTDFMQTCKPQKG